MSGNEMAISALEIEELEITDFIDSAEAKDGEIVARVMSASCTTCVCTCSCVVPAASN